MEPLTGKPLSMIRLWRNPTVRRLIIILIIALFIYLVFIGIYSYSSSQSLKRDWLEREAATLGTLMAEDPELAEKWLSLIAETDIPSSAVITEGRQLMERSGMTLEMESSLIPVIEEYRSRTWWSLFAGTVGLFVLITLLLMRESRKQLGEMRSLAIALEDTVKHNKPMAYRLYDEGELGLLANGVQELTIRLRQTIDHLQQDKAFLKDTVADISHQLKTPLASLMIYVDLLREGKADSNHAAEFLETCRRELDRMEWLTLTLLKLARLEADALEMNLRATPLVNTVKQAMNAVHRLAEDKHVHLVLEESDLAISPPHDSHWLAEAITNLIKNAIDHSPRGSEVTISWEHTPVFTRLHVKDQGRGIEMKHLPHIFKKFYRASSEGSGVGLGLPLAKSIVERHGGILSAAPNPSGGTSFVLTLPHHPFPSPATKLTEL